MCHNPRLKNCTVICNRLPYPTDARNHIPSRTPTAVTTNRACNPKTLFRPLSEEPEVILSGLGGVHFPSPVSARQAYKHQRSGFSRKIEGDRSLHRFYNPGQEHLQDVRVMGPPRNSEGRRNRFYNIREGHQGRRV